MEHIVDINSLSKINVSKLLFDCRIKCGKYLSLFKIKIFVYFQNVGKFKTSLGLLHTCLFKLLAQWNSST